jgi:hypothetical protein
MIPQGTTSHLNCLSELRLMASSGVGGIQNRTTTAVCHSAQLQTVSCSRASSCPVSLKEGLAARVIVSDYTTSHACPWPDACAVCCLSTADKPGSEEPHYHMQQEEHVRVKQGKLGYFIGHQTHVQSAEADEEVVIKPGVCVLWCDVVCPGRGQVKYSTQHSWRWGTGAEDSVVAAFKRVELAAGVGCVCGRRITRELGHTIQWHVTSSWLVPPYMHNSKVWSSRP